MRTLQSIAAVSAACLALSGAAGILPVSPAPAAITAYAATVTADSVEYTLFDNYAVVSDYQGSADEITIPDKVEGLPVTAVGEKAFEGTKLKSVTLPESVTEIGEAAFAGALSLETVVCPGVKQIGALAFYQCERLQSVSMPEGLREVRMSAFDGCIRLAKFNIPSTLTEIGKNAFLGTAWFTAQQQFEVPVEINHIVVDPAKSRGAVTIPDGVTTINNGAFADCTGITEIRIPDSVTEIRAGAFSGCTGLTSIILPKNVTVIPEEMCKDCTALTELDGFGAVTEVGESAFRNTGLIDIKLPDTVTAVGESAFEGCKDLKRFNIPGLRKIGKAAFRDCESLYWFNEAEIEEIGEYAFMGCGALPAFSAPNTLQQIGTGAFKECTKLGKVYLRKNLSSIDTFAFSGCISLTDLSIYSPFAKLGDNILQDCPHVVLEGYDGSSAEQYAGANKLQFQSMGALKLLYGDVNGNETVGADDAQAILKAYTEQVAGKPSGFLELQAKAADVDLDGKVSVEDAQMTLRYYTEKYVAGKDITWSDIRSKIEVPNKN